MIFTFDSVNWFNKLIRPFFATIDAVIYRLIGWILEGILNLSDLFANPTFVNTIYRRIYVVLAIFMVFKLTFSFIQYIVNPDAMTDKEKGVGKLISRTIVMLVLIIFVPILFFEEITVPGGSKGTLLNVLQRGVLKTLPQVVLGVDSNEVNKNSGSDGESIALMMLGSLYYKTDCESSKSNCETGLKAAISDFDAFEGSVNINDSGKFDYKYMWPLTTVAGIMLVVILLGIAIDVAIRVFKIMVLQMIAPIPIMSYIDPKASKDGAFSSWLKMYISTYLDIFVKIGTVYLLMLIIGNLFTDNGIFGTQIKAHTSFMTRSFLIIFLTIGLFKFAKDAPKFIKDAMGIKDSGGGGSFMGKALAGAAGAAMGFAGGFATGGLAGGLSGITTGASAGFAGKAGQAFSQVRDEQAKLLGKTPGGIKGKLQNKAMQRSVMKHTGLDKNKLDTMKKAKIDADNELALAEADYANGKISAQDLKDAREKSGKANSAYENANALAKQIGLKPGFMQENKRHGAAYVATKRAAIAAGGVASSVGDKINSLPSTQWIKDKADDISNIPSTVRHAYDSARYHGSDNADILQRDRETIRNDREAYKDSLRGGVGADSKKETQENLRQTLKNDRQTYRDDKKHFKKNS